MEERPCFTWIIDNISMCTNGPGVPLSSPPFYVDGSSVEQFCMQLYVRGFFKTDDGQTSTLLLRRVGNKAADEVIMVYRLCVTTGDTMYTRTRKHEHTFTNDETFLRDLRIFSLSCKTTDILQASQLIIKCTILDFAVRLFDEVENVEELCYSFEHLFDVGIHSDVQIRVQNEIFKTHKAVLDARCPALVEKYKVENVLKDFTIDDIDAETFRMFLIYLYAGFLEVGDLPTNICGFLETYNVPYVKYPVCIPVETTFTTKFNSLHFSTIWSIEEYLNKEVQRARLYKIVGDNAQPWSLLEFNLIFAHDVNSKQFPLIFVKGLKCNGEKIANNFKISLTRPSGESVSVYNVQNIAIYEESKKLPVTFEFGQWWWQNTKKSFLENGAISLLIEVDVCKREHSTAVSVHRNAQLQNLPDPSYLEGSKAFHNHLKHMFENQKYCDVTLTVAEQKFFAHKSVLSARSEVFCKMFEHPTIENLSGEVEIQDVGAEAMLTLLRFMYCAEIERPKKTEEAIDLYYAAHKYQILTLEQKCSTYLATHLTTSSFIQILDIADKLNDFTLKSRVFKFILDNADRVLSNKEWKDVLVNYPYLACEIVEHYLDFILQLRKCRTR